MKKLLLFGVLAIIFFGNIKAYGANSDPISISTLQVNTSPDRIHLFNITYSTPAPSCNRAGDPVLLLNPNEIGAPSDGKAIYAAMLSAAASGKQIIISADSCWNDFPIINGITVLF